MSSSGPKISVSLHSYGGELIPRKMTVKEVLKDISEIEGVEGVELIDNMHIPNWPNPRILDWRELMKHIKSLGLEVACYSTYMDTEINSRRSATLEEQVEMIRESIARADLLGSRVVRVEQPPRTKEDFMKEADEATWVGGGPYVLYSESAKRGLEMCIPTCEEYDVKVCIEIHAPTNPKWYIDLMKKVESKYIGLCPDFSTWATKQPAYSGWGWGTLEQFKECIPYTFHVHAKCLEFDKNGEEPAIPFGDLIPALKNGGYNGYISVEFAGWYIKDYDCRETARTATALIKKFL